MTESERAQITEQFYRALTNPAVGLFWSADLRHFDNGGPSVEALFTGRRTLTITWTDQKAADLFAETLARWKSEGRTVMEIDE